MNTYRMIFAGRQVGAIGIRVEYQRDVEAPSVESAIMRLYETHEHISVTSIVTIDPGEARAECRETETLYRATE